jgi:hypothetical protein
MKSEKLSNLLANMRPWQDLVDDFFPQLSTMNEDTWTKSRYGDTKENDLCTRFRELGAEDQTEISNSMQDIPGEDLITLQGLAPKEFETRRGISQLQQAKHSINQQLEESTRYLHKLQSIREFSLIEMERRQRAQMVADGQGPVLDQFCSRYVFGPPPAPMIPPNQVNQNLGPKKREWFTARVKSGKIVAVEHIRFDIPEVYERWVIGELKKAGLYKTNGYRDDLDRRPNPVIARFYYKLGFLPSKMTTLNYQIYWFDQNWRNGWSFSHCREINTNELKPVD